MIRRVFSILVVSAIISSCGNTGKKEVSSKAEGTSETVKVEFASLVENPDSFIGKEISVEGKVVHVCAMSGKKMFIVGENPDIRLYIEAGEEMAKFPMELLGSEIIVEGKLVKATAGAMEGEGMMKGEGAGKKAAGDSCETETALAAQPVLADLMMIYSKHSVK